MPGLANAIQIFATWTVAFAMCKAVSDGVGTRESSFDASIKLTRTSDSIVIAAIGDIPAAFATGTTDVSRPIEEKLIKHRISVKIVFIDAFQGRVFGQVKNNRRIPINVMF